MSKRTENIGGALLLLLVVMLLYLTFDMQPIALHRRLTDLERRVEQLETGK